MPTKNVIKKNPQVSVDLHQGRAIVGARGARRKVVGHGHEGRERDEAEDHAHELEKLEVQAHTHAVPTEYSADFRHNASVMGFSTPHVRTPRTGHCMPRSATSKYFVTNHISKATVRAGEAAAC